MWLDAAPRFLWIPGVGPDSEALLRLEREWPRPSQPMGEAWFMGGHRRMFHNLVEHNPATIPAEELVECLSEIATGTCSFGPAQEWTDWFHYLLPRLVPRALEGQLEYLVEPIVTAFIALHPEGGGERVTLSRQTAPGFLSDALTTLGRVLMEPSLWDAREIAIGRMLHPPRVYGNERWWGWFKVSGDFAALMVFTWKYLNPEQIDGWVQSVLMIESSHWRAQLVVWLLGALPLITGEITQPGELARLDPDLTWAYSSCLAKPHDEQGAIIRTPLISEPNREAFREGLYRHLTASLVLEWIDSFAQFDYLEQELDRLPDYFIQAYSSHGFLRSE